VNITGSFQNNWLVQTEQIARLTATIRSLEEALKQKDVSLDKEKAGKKALGRLLANKSEKVPVENDPCPETAMKKTAPSPKERGNNNTRRKVHFNLETMVNIIGLSLFTTPTLLNRLFGFRLAMF
jgi:hypothetical protein